MIDRCLVGKVGIVATFLFLVMMPDRLMAEKLPDFAFPQTVERNAEADYSRAMKAGDSQGAISAAIKIAISKNLISHSNYVEGIKLLEELGEKLDAPYCSLAYLLEAQLYTEIYNSSSWNYDNRTIPLTEAPQDVEEWSRDIFESKVRSLIEQSCGGDSVAKGIKLRDIEQLLETSDDWVENNMTVYDFMTLKKAELLKIFKRYRNQDIIPFGYGIKTVVSKKSDDISETAEALIDENISWHDKRGDVEQSAVMSAYKLSVLGGEERDKFADSCLKKYIDTPYCASFISQSIAFSLWNEVEIGIEGVETESYRDKENKKIRHWCELIESYLTKFPNCKNSAALKNLLEEFLAERISINIDGRVYPGEEFSAKVRGENIFAFNILVVKLPDSYLNKEIGIAAIKRYGRVEESISVKMNGSKPARMEEIVKFSPLGSGIYALVPSSTGLLSDMIAGCEPNIKFATFNVTRLTSFRSSDNINGSGGDRFYVIDGKNQSPIEGAKVTLISRNKDKKRIERFTGKDGYVNIPKGSYEVLITKGKDRLGGDLWNSGNGHSGNIRKEMQAKVLTDLAIYHPGDSVGFMGIVYYKEGRELYAQKGAKVTAVLNDANYQEVEKIDLESDSLGRVTGRFKIPESGLLGSYTIHIKDEAGHYIGYGNGVIEVSDYKSPTFLVEIDSMAKEYQVGDTVKITGRVSTYSGMPVRDGSVKYEVRYRSPRWFNSNDNSSYGGETVSSENGRFEIELPTEGLRSTRYALGTYELKVIVTNETGETQEVSGVWFSLGRSYTIAASLPDKICANQGVQEFAVRVTDMIGTPVKRKIYYKIAEAEEGRIIDSGEFESPVFRFDGSVFKSGLYKIVFSLDEDFKDKENYHQAYSNVIIYREGDKSVPYPTPLWVPETKIIVPEGRDSVRISVGSSYQDSWIFVQIADCDDVIERRWLHVDANIETIDVPVPASNNRIAVKMFGMRDFDQRMVTVTIIPAKQVEKLDVESISFRNHITPCSSERWRFRFCQNGSALAGIPVAAVMTNYALNHIKPFEWIFNPEQSVWYDIKGDIQWGYYRSGWNWSITLTKPDRGNFRVDRLPNWNLYGMSLYMRESAQRMYKARAGGVVSYAYADGVVEKNSMAMTASAYDRNVKEEMEDAEYADSMVETGNVTAERMDVSDELRPTEYPLVFFKPHLISDENGEAEIDFTVPNFNGTWQFQIMGYTEKMKVGKMILNTVSSKPVMTQMNAPRFVRSGDRMSVTALAYNNSIDISKVSGKIEIFNPLSGDILFVESKEEEVEPTAAVKVFAEYVVPSDLSYIGIRAFAYGDSHTDGEETIIPAYPSSTPTIESETFYISPENREFVMTVPPCEEGAKVTLVYNDNPIWDVVTALPEIAEAKSSDVISLVSSLFGNAIGVGLMRDYPEISEAIKIFSNPANSKDSTLVSNLERNQSLKSVVLNNTPWVRTAESETLRMKSLVQYSDAPRCMEILASNLRDIEKLQNTDGGWSWCGGMKSSEFITETVLSHLAKLRDIGYLPEGGEAMAKRGLKYLDSCWVKSVNEYKGKSFPYITMLKYLYVRSSFRDVEKAKGFDAVWAKGLKAVKDSWKKLGVYEKGTASILLGREGYKMEARTILESLRQYASYTEEKGMWFDNLSSPVDGWDRLLTTSKALEAYCEIEQNSENVDMLRQWLLLAKQTENWGENRALTEVIYSILTSGSCWTHPSSEEEIIFAGEKIEIDRVAELTGKITLNLAAKGGEELRIKKGGTGPAWGSIIQQNVAPISKVTDSSVPELSIAKNIYVITSEGNDIKATSDRIFVGDKVRVTLTVKCDRDLQYVAIKDARSASLEPVNQLSGYASSDGVWFYKEIRDDSTNLFIPYLEKGTHVLSYDCYADRVGEYSLGIASAQSQYAPGIAAHSGGSVIKIEVAKVR